MNHNPLKSLNSFSVRHSAKTDESQQAGIVQKFSDRDLIHYDKNIVIGQMESIKLMSYLYRDDIKDCLFLKKSNSDVLIVAFSSFDLYRNENKKFDYYYMTKQDHVDILLVRDLNNTWYHQPISGDNNGEEKLIQYIREVSKGYRRVVCIGSSMGGYGAIFFGLQIPANLVIAFSPQIIIDPVKLNNLKDYRNIDYMIKAYRLCKNREFSDLSLIKNFGNTKVNIYFGRNDKNDKNLFNILSNNKFYDIECLKHVNHGLVHALKVSGALDEIIKFSISSDEIYNPQRYLNNLKKNIAVNSSTESIIIDNNVNKLHITIKCRLGNMKFWDFGGNFWLFTKIINESTQKEVLWEISKENDTQIFGNILKYKTVIDLSEYKSGIYSIELSPSLGKFYITEIGYRSLCYYIRIYNGSCYIIDDKCDIKFSPKNIVKLFIFYIFVRMSSRKKRIKFNKDRTKYFLDSKNKFIRLLGHFF